MLNTKFATAIRKYGDALVWSVIDSDVPNELLNAREEVLIAEYDSYHSSYNSTLGGDGGNTYVSFDENRRVEVLKKISEGVKRAWQNEEFRSHMRDMHSGSKNPMYGRESAMKGKKHTDETKQKISDSHSGVNNPFFGKAHSEETKNKWKGRVPWNKGRSHSEETKLKMKKTAKLRKRNKHSEETKRKISDANKRRWQDGTRKDREIPSCGDEAVGT